MDDNIDGLNTKQEYQPGCPLLVVTRLCTQATL